MTGAEFADWISKYIVTNFGDRGLSVYREVSVGKSIIGKNRRVDILVVDNINNKAIAFECKYQAVTGTVDEKVPYTINDAESMQMDSYIVYGGTGFSKGVIHMLEASELACHAEPDMDHLDSYKRTKDTKELDQILAMRLHWWDVFTEKAKEVIVE